MIVGLAIGAVLGLAVGAVLGRLSPRSEVVPELSEDDREQLADQFRTHTDAVAEQVGLFADELAGDDVVLRERLRRFERGC